MRTNKSLVGGLRRVHVSSIVSEVIKTISFFVQKRFERIKTQIKQKSTKKTETSKQKTTKAIVFHTIRKEDEENWLIWVS